MARFIYQAQDGQDWEAVRFSELALKYGVPEDGMNEFHGLISEMPDHWKLLRNLYGINPVFGEDDELIQFPLSDETALAANMGISMEELSVMQEYVGKKWRERRKELPPEATPIPSVESPPQCPPSCALPQNGQPAQQPDYDPDIGPPVVYPEKRKGGRGRQTNEYNRLYQEALEKDRARQARIEAKKKRLEAEALAKNPPPKPEPPPPKRSNMDKLGVSEEEWRIIGELGFRRSIFMPGTRDESVEAEEIHWFANRLSQLRKAFEEPMSSTLARQVIANELFLRRCDDAVLTVMPGDGDALNVKAIHDDKREVERIYATQLEELDTMCPFIKGLERKHEVNGTVAEIIEACRDYAANGDNQKVDGIFSAFDVQILTRASAQDSEPKYRPGMVAALCEAKAAIFDPTYRRKLPTVVCKALDEAFRAAHAKMVEAGVIKLVDLEKDNRNGEWPAFTVEVEEGSELAEEEQPADEPAPEDLAAAPKLA